MDPFWSTWVGKNKSYSSSFASEKSSQCLTQKILVIQSPEWSRNAFFIEAMRGSGAAEHLATRNKTACLWRAASNQAKVHGLFQIEGNRNSGRQIEIRVQRTGTMTRCICKFPHPISACAWMFATLFVTVTCICNIILFECVSNSVRHSGDIEAFDVADTSATDRW